MKSQKIISRLMKSCIFSLLITSSAYAQKSLVVVRGRDGSYKVVNADMTNAFQVLATPNDFTLPNLINTNDFLAESSWHPYPPGTEPQVGDLIYVRAEDKVQKFERFTTIGGENYILTSAFSIDPDSRTRPQDFSQYSLTKVTSIYSDVARSVKPENYLKEFGPVAARKLSNAHSVFNGTHVGDFKSVFENGLVMMTPTTTYVNRSSAWNLYKDIFPQWAQSHERSNKYASFNQTDYELATIQTAQFSTASATIQSKQIEAGDTFEYKFTKYEVQLVFPNGYFLAGNNYAWTDGSVRGPVGRGTQYLAHINSDGNFELVGEDSDLAQSNIKSLDDLKKNRRIILNCESLFN